MLTWVEVPGVRRKVCVRVCVCVGGGGGGNSRLVSWVVWLLAGDMFEILVKQITGLPLHLKFPQSRSGTLHKHPGVSVAVVVFVATVVTALVGTTWKTLERWRRMS